MQPNAKCRVCGKDYFCCVDSRRFGGFRSVACSEECFKIYIEKVEEQRAKEAKEAEKSVSIKKNETPTVELTETNDTENAVS